MKRIKYAETSFSWSDIKQIKPEWDKAKCELFLQTHQDAISDVMIAEGVFFINDKLDKE